MIISRNKRKSNIAEYILYMWQIEDIIRSQQFNLEAIEKNIIDKFKVTGKDREEFVDWYANLIMHMKQDKIEQSGHLKFLENLVHELQSFHTSLLNSTKHEEYGKLYNNSKQYIEELGKKTPQAINEIDICLRGLYGVLVLKLKQVSISEETQKAFQSISQLVALLSDLFKKYENGEIEAP
jgi:hypothetical protein